MEHRIEIRPAQQLIGQHLTMSLSDNKTRALWQCFMPRRKEIKNTLNADLFSMQVYDSAFDFSNFNPHTPFEKWAAAAVTDIDFVPEGMETFELPGGCYAVFLHKGDASTAEKTFRYIFETWLPDSEYVLDNRPHFELIGEKYKNDHPDSEEEVWIPVKPK